MSTVSAVVLTYNKAWIVRECLASLRCQSRQANEVIVVDDASTDDTRSELANLPASWLRLTQRKNGGQSRARNIGFRYATGDYLVFIDGDVVMESDMLESMARALRSDAAGNDPRRRSPTAIIYARGRGATRSRLRPGTRRSFAGGTTSPRSAWFAGSTCRSRPSTRRCGGTRTGTPGSACRAPAGRES